MSTPMKLSQLPLATTTDDKTIIVTDSQGNPERFKAINLNSFLMNVVSTYVTDFNEATTQGIWLVDGSSNPANSPAGVQAFMGILEVFRRYSRVFQRLMGYDRKIALRTGLQNEDGSWTWTDWHVM